MLATTVRHSVGGVGWLAVTRWGQKGKKGKKNIVLERKVYVCT